MSTVTEVSKLLPGVIKNFQSTLSNYQFPNPNSHAEEFAIQRFKKKFEEPENSNQLQLASDCWDSFIGFDSNLTFAFPLPGEWYVARQQLHAALEHFNVQSVRFPKGSEFVATRGYNSLQARLECSKWTCTRSAYDKFAELCYKHKALRRAAKRRYREWYDSKSFTENFKQSNRILYNHYSVNRVVANGDPSYGPAQKVIKSEPCRLNDVKFEIFKWKLSRIVTIVEGSRFATVPKNNEKRRPINVEPFGNLVYEAGIGDHIRDTILPGRFGVDLNTLQDLHRKRISSKDVATIDLQNASDSVSMKLVEFLFPKWFVSLIEDARSSMVLGPDGAYYPLNKVSSMGNGFTFELMTLILTTICRVLDPNASVFGDDIIIANEHAERLIQLLTSVGFVVNNEKSFVNSPFRESCGAFFLDGHGYIESYDFLYPETIGDCVAIFNKLRRLSKIYPAFKPLHQSLYRSLPHALRGGPDHLFDTLDCVELVGQGRKDLYETKQVTTYWEDQGIDIPPFFVTDKISGLTKEQASNYSSILADFKYMDRNAVHYTICFRFTNTLRTPTYNHLRSTSWAKYEMYLDANARVDDVVTGQGKWTSYVMLNTGYSRFRAISNKAYQRMKHLS